MEFIVGCHFMGQIRLCRELRAFALYFSLALWLVNMTSVIITPSAWTLGGTTLLVKVLMFYSIGRESLSCEQEKKRRKWVISWKRCNRSHTVHLSMSFLLLSVHLTPVSPCWRCWLTLDLPDTLQPPGLNTQHYWGLPSQCLLWGELCPAKRYIHILTPISVTPFLEIGSLQTEIKLRWGH